MTRFLILGQTGQVARELARSAPDSVCLGRNEANLSDPRACAEAVAAHAGAVSAVINAAAWTAVDAAEESEDAARLVNAEAPGAMARTCAAAGLPFLHVSTDYVFDGTGDRPWQPQDPTGPLGAYGRTKLAGEEAVRQAGGAHLILRTSWVFSAHGANFVKTMLRLSESRDRLQVVADQVGGPTPAADIARTLVTAARALAAGQGGGTYHLAGQPFVSWAGFARAIFAEAGRDVAVEEIASSAWPTPARRPANSRLDGRALEADFGIGPPDWMAGLRSVITELES